MKQETIRKRILTGLFVIICIIYLMPVFTVLMNSFKTNYDINSDTFAFPNDQKFTGADN